MLKTERIQCQYRLASQVNTFTSVTHPTFLCISIISPQVLNNCVEVDDSSTVTQSFLEQVTAGEVIAPNSCSPPPSQQPLFTTGMFPSLFPS